MSDLSYYAQCDSIEQIRSELSCIWGLKNLNDLISENIYIWGIGLLGKFVVEQFKENNKNIKGILTSDNKQIGENYKGIPFVSLDKVGLEDLIVVCHIMDIRDIYIMKYFRFYMMNWILIIWDLKECGRH